MHSDALRQWPRRACALAGVLACCLGSPAQSEASPPVQRVQEDDLKAAFVFNFAVFTEWPQDALASGAPISLCASTTNPMLVAMEKLKDKVVNGHRVAVRAAAAPLRGCHVLLLDRSDRERWSQFKRELSGATVLTVSDDEAISEDGAVIALSVSDRRVGFDVDLVAARGARLNLSSKLLRLARNVQ